MRVCRTLLTGCTFAACLLVVPTAGHAQSLSQPDGWEVRAERFVAMPPGFHITTSPSVLLYHPEARAEGTFTVESEGFLFQGESTNSFGLFVGGRDLEGDAAAWTSFEISRDGTWVVRERRNRGGAHGAVVTDLAGPKPGPVATPGDEATAKNVLAVVAGEEDVEFRISGVTVTALPRVDLAVDGIVGFRVGSDLNLHLTTLSITSEDETTEWAPQPAEAATEGGV